MNLLLAIDASPFSEAAVQTVIDCWRPQGTTVRVLHAIDWCHKLSACATYSEGPSAARAVVLMEEELRRRRVDLLARVVARLVDAGFAASPHVVEEEPCTAILATAAHWPCDVVVVGSHFRHGADRVLSGSVSERVCRLASCSVLIARPRIIPHDVKKSPLHSVEPLM